MKILKGQKVTAPKVMIYGVSGCGKSTLASKLRRPLFMDFEGGLNYVGVDRTPLITQLDDFYAYLKELILLPADKREYDTIVIDSADWLVRKVTEKAAGITVSKLEETLNRSNGGYGNGKQVLENHIRTYLLPVLMKLNSMGYGICLVAHADRKHVMTSEGYDVEQITPKIDSNTMNVFVEWCDNVFYLKKDENGKRTLVLESDDVALAKNRLSLTGEVSLDEIDINKLLTMSGKEK